MLPGFRGLSTLSTDELVNLVAREATRAGEYERVAGQAIGLIQLFKGLVGDLTLTGALPRKKADVLWERIELLEKQPDEEDE